MKLYAMEDIIETLISVPDIKGAPYIELEEKLLELKPAMIIPECGGCMGPSYNPRDCEECKNGWSRSDDRRGSVGRLPTIEVNEDNKAYTYCSRCGMRVVVEAPSVVPSRAESEDEE